MKKPIIIQGGMGIAVSNWCLARAVSLTGHLGVVSGTALDTVFARRLQDGDPGGHMRRAVEQFPDPAMARRVFDRYFISGGRTSQQPYACLPMPAIEPTQAQLELLVLANFVEVHTAKVGHGGLVGINYLEKIQLPTLPSLYGAMLAGVDFVLMGAGIPRAIPGILDRLSGNEDVSLKLAVEGASGEDRCETEFSPRAFSALLAKKALRRPAFLAIVSSAVLATNLARKSTGKIDGFVLEHHCAGGHNAPPRGGIVVNELGEPVYSNRDEIDIDAIKKLELPFWLAGSYGYPEKLKQALSLGASGIQVGTLFALCRESGLTSVAKSALLDSIACGTATIFTDPIASPTGFPFKIVQLEGSLSENSVYEERKRVCDLGYLRTAYKNEDGEIGFRCPGEPVDIYCRKGGVMNETCGRKCLCNALLADVGLAQVRKDGSAEKALLTAGGDLEQVSRFLRQRSSKSSNQYGAQEVIEYLMTNAPANGSSEAAAAVSS